MKFGVLIIKMTIILIMYSFNKNIMLFSVKNACIVHKLEARQLYLFVGSEYYYQMRADLLLTHTEVTTCQHAHTVPQNTHFHILTVRESVVLRFT